MENTLNFIKFCEKYTKNYVHIDTQIYFLVTNTLNFMTFLITVARFK